MAFSDKYPTCYDLRPIRPEELHRPQLSITEVELKALEAIDLGEKLSEGLNKFDLARGAIKLSARIARKFRK
jgi:hypothetical protein